MKGIKQILKEDVLELQNKFTVKWVLKMIVKIALIVFGIYLIYEYLPPLIYKGILDAGNAFGLGAALLLILTGIFSHPIGEWLKGLWNRSAGGKAVIIAVCVFAVAFVGVFIPTLVSVIRYSEYNATNETTVIVLGCKVNGTKASYALWMRTDNAAKYLQAHPDAVAILSGGQGHDEGISEAKAMEAIFKKEGIPESRYFLEDKSTSTDENMAFSKRIMEEHGLSKKVVISTHDYHQKRAAMIARKNGLEPVSLPAPSVRWSKATFFTREVFGIWFQWIKN